MRKIVVKYFLLIIVLTIFMPKICAEEGKTLKCESGVRQDMSCGDYIVQGYTADDSGKLDTYNWETNGIPIMYRQNGVKTAGAWNVVFCAQRGSTVPAQGGGGIWKALSCSSEYKFTNDTLKNNKLKAAMGYVINKYISGIAGRINSDAEKNVFVNIQNAIHKLLENKNSEGAAHGNSDYYSEAEAIYNKYGNETLSVGSLSFSSSGNNWIATTTLTTNTDSVSLDSIKLGNTEVSSNYVTISGNSITITIPKSVVTTTSTVTLKIKGTTAYNIADARHCDTGRQPIIESVTKSTTTTKEVTATGTITPGYTNKVQHWLAGFQKEEGTNSYKNALWIYDSTFDKNVNEKFTLGSEKSITSPNGFTLRQSFSTGDISDDGSWHGYKLGTEVTQKSKTMTFQYFYDPVNYKITYDLNGGTNNSNNPTTYSVLYGATFQNPTRKNYEFGGWYKKIRLNGAIGKSTSQFNFITILDGLKSNTTYYISANDVKLTKGNASEFDIILYNFSSNKRIETFSSKFNSSFSHAFTTPNGLDKQDIRIIMYAGKAGSTKGNSLTYKDLTVSTDPITGVNEGVTNANFKNMTKDKIYEELRNRTTGNIEVIAHWIPYGKIKVHKVKSDGTGLINKKVKFGAYSDASCNNLVSTFEGTTNSQGYVEGSVAPGTYWIKEISIDSDIYKKSDECVYIGRVDLDTTVSSDYTNVTYCESDYNSNKTIANRLKLYNNYGFNNLLNFDKTELKDVCTTYNPKYIRETSCLYSNQNSEVFEEESQVEKIFSGTDLSAYNETIDINPANGKGYKGYCLTSFFLEHNFHVLTQLEETNKKAGQLVIQAAENEYAGTGYISMTCYVYNGYYESGAKPDTINTGKTYGDYINSISLDDKALRSYDTSEELVLDYLREENEFYIYDLVKPINYYLNEVCVNRITGRVYENSSCKEVCESPSSLCKFLGYGVLSNFNDALESNPSFNFSITPGDIGAQIFDFENDIKREDSKISVSKSNTSCSYSIDPEIIEYSTPESNGNLELEFRTIDTNNPFVNREPNSNWKNDDINKVIINGYNNSYNGTGEAPKYKITLTPSDIQEIRSYNNGTGKYSNPHPYDDYEISCNDLNNKCGNAFLKKFGITKSN